MQKLLCTIMISEGDKVGQGMQRRDSGTQKGTGSDYGKGRQSEGLVGELTACP